MKKNYFLSLFVLSASLFQVHAQVVNGGFETVKPNNMVSNWGMNFLYPVSIDQATGTSTQDDILFGTCMNAFVYPTMDAHTGNYALAITNGLNATQNQVIGAKAVLFNDSLADFPGWNPGVPVNATDSVTMLGFFYKFFPQGSDVAEAVLTVFDENGMEIGKAHVAITVASTEFSYLYTPFEFTSQGTPAFMMISFSMVKEGSVPAFGSTLIVDDVVVNLTALKNTQFQASKFAIYPTVAKEEITITKGTFIPDGTYSFQIASTQGQIISKQSVFLTTGNAAKIDVSYLATGVYFVTSEGFTAKIIKQ